MINLKVSDEQYLNWQKKLAENKFFRWFWVFWGIGIVGVYYAGVILFLVPKYRHSAILAFAAFLLAKFVISLAVRFLFPRTRPYQKNNFTPPSCVWLMSRLHKKPNSMPSTHAASLITISVVFLWFLPVLGILGLIAVVLNGVARVILGYHYISDVLVGWLVGLASAWVVVYWLAPIIIK